MPLKTFALKLEYDGAGFGGSQYQTNARSVQAEVERALQPLGACGRVAMAGRTDAGVHAKGQVAVTLLPETWTPAAVLKAVNARLPFDVAVVAATLAPDGFDPRRRAWSRRYGYRVQDRPVRSPLLRRCAWHVKYPLDEGRIAAAAAALVGEHDFAAFGGPQALPGAGTVRRMLDVSVRRKAGILCLEFEATAFLPHQVRRTVGALVEVGRGKMSREEFESHLDEARPGTVGPAAPAHGLCLLRVVYSGLSFAEPPLDAEAPEYLSSCPDFDQMRSESRVADGRGETR